MQLSGRTAVAVTRRTWLRRAAAVLAGGAGLGYLHHSNTLTVNRFTRHIGVGQPLRVMLLSDWHAPRCAFEPRELHRLAETLAPDLVLVLGDSIDVHGNEPLARDLFGPIPAPLGKFAVFGNHEYWHNVDRVALARHYAEGGVDLLDNRVALVGDVRIVGLADTVGGTPAWDLVPADDGPALVMSHCPATMLRIVQRLGRGGIVCSGHTHGGQISPLGCAIYTPPGSGDFVRDWYTVRDRPLYVSPGLGCVSINLRVGVPPTVTLLTVT